MNNVYKTLNSLFFFFSLQGQNVNKEKLNVQLNKEISSSTLKSLLLI